MKLLIITLTLILIGCNLTNKVSIEDTRVTRSEEYQNEINEFLAKDAENKQREKDLLEEIRIAQENNDQDAFQFFFEEYINVERLAVPEWMKEEPNYVEGGVNVKY
jgi:hypothetical protein